MGPRQRVARLWVVGATTRPAWPASEGMKGMRFYLIGRLVVPSSNRRTSRLLAVGVVSITAGTCHTVQAQQVVVVTGSRPVYSASYTFDSFMSSNFAPSGNSSYIPVVEGELGYLASEFAGWIIKPLTPTAAMTLDICAMSKTTAATREVTKDSLPEERKAAANQVFFGNLPNFSNVQKDGLIVAVIFSDGSKEQFRHTTAAGLIPMSGTFIPGTGTSRCSA